jgi:large subunit ribosomal protein L30
MSSKLRVRLRKSPISYTDRTRGTVRALGLHRLHETVEVPDNPATRGMVRAIRFLVEVEVIGAPARPKGASVKRAPTHTGTAGAVGAAEPARAAEEAATPEPEEGSTHETA